MLSRALTDSTNFEHILSNNSAILLWDLGKYSS